MSYAPARPARLATAKQIAFVATLAAERGVEAPVVTTAAQASAQITRLLALPRPAKAAPAAAAPVEVPAARYAVPGRDGWEFYRVDRPAKGKWAGYTFVKRLYGSPGDFRDVRVPREAAAGILGRIAAARYEDGARVLTGAEAAAVAFSREHGVCAACLAPLTDAESIARGLGPICAARF